MVYVHTNIQLQLKQSLVNTTDLNKHKYIINTPHCLNAHTRNRLLK